MKWLHICRIAALWLACFTTAHAQNATTMESRNKEIIATAFEQWASGAGVIFDLLADDVEWTITGNSRISKVYTSRRQFIDEAIVPLNQRLSKKIVPTVRALYAEGNTVVALWDGAATAADGQSYHNTYAWFMEMKDGRIVKVIAFFDAIALNAVWDRITP